jgi:tetratricopeptide (TPR) repeat protein
MRNYREALRSHAEALKISEEIKSRSGIAVNHGNLGAVYFSMATDSGRALSGAAKASALQNAINHLEEAVRICKEINFAGPLVEFNQLLSDAYAKAGNYKRSLGAYKEYIATKDSLYSTQSRAEIANLETKREMGLREKNLLIKEKQLQINKLQIAEKRNERIIFIVSTALLLVLVGVSLKTLQRYRTSNRALRAEKDKYLDQVESQIDRLKKQSLVLDEISHIQSHDIRGPVATILGLTYLFNLENTADPQNKFVIEGITSVTKQLDQVIKNVVEKNNSFTKEQE